MNKLLVLLTVLIMTACGADDLTSSAMPIDTGEVKQDISGANCMVLIDIAVEETQLVCDADLAVVQADYETCLESCGSGGGSGGGGSPPPTCFDGIMNSDEEGIDCGGFFAMCPPC